jgi:hypothetical protein
VHFWGDAKGGPESFFGLDIFNIPSVCNDRFRPDPNQ